MLTFFRYLRQRVVQLVLAAVQEARELLQSQEDRSQAPKHESNLPAPRLASQAGAPPKRPETSSRQEDASSDSDELLPPPRRCVRPDQKPKGKA